MESPGLALRVEIPFSRDTPKRVPAGTTILSGEAARAAAGCEEGRGAADGADCCGPSGCCARIVGKLAKMASKTLAPRVVVRSRIFTASLPFGYAMRKSESADA